MTFYYRSEVQAIAHEFRLDPDIVTAICLVESSGKTHAYRYEPHFWLRYLAGKPEWADQNPDRVSASYGLMQVMYPVALENGYPKDDPPEWLFVPTVGLSYGCKHFAGLVKWAKGDTLAALAAYNGGKKGNVSGGPLRNQSYVNRILKELARVKEA